MAWDQTIVGAAIGATVPSLFAVWIWWKQRQKDDLRAESAREEQTQIFRQLVEDLRRIEHDREAFSATTAFTEACFSAIVSVHKGDDDTFTVAAARMASEISRGIRYATGEAKLEFRLVERALSEKLEEDTGSVSELSQEAQDDLTAFLLTMIDRSWKPFAEQ